MPLKTKHYGLSAFLSGEKYLSELDRERMLIIDNEMSLIADQVGDGRIEGWSVEQLNGFKLRVQRGSGLIGGVFTQTHGFIDFDVSDNNRWRVYINRRPGVIGWYGPSGVMQTLSFTDSSTPAATVLSISSSSVSSVALTWTRLVAPNIEFYSVFRSDDGGATFRVLATTSDHIYTDPAVDPASTYVYYVTATNFSGTTGPASNHVTATTNDDTSPPGDPSSVEMHPGSGFLQMFWVTAVGSIDHYEITVRPVDGEGNPEGPPQIHTYSASAIQATIVGLTNGQNYLVTIKSVSPAGVSSGGIQAYGVPTFSPGPPEIVALELSDFSIDTAGNAGIHATWETEADPYNAAAVYYLVTVTPADGQPSQPSIYTDSTINITAFTNVAGAVLPIRELSTYFVRIQGVNSAGNTNRGVLGKIVTRKFTRPAPVTSLAVEQPSPKIVTARWINSTSPFSFNSISVTKVNLTTFASEAIEVATNIGRQTSYSIPQAFIEPGVRFDFTVTVHDIYGNESTPAIVNFVIGEDVIYPDRPPVPLFQAARGGDGEVVVVWSDPDTSNLLDSLKWYKIYRADFGPRYAATDFRLVGRVPADTFQFSDLTVENKKRYVYFVTSVTSSAVESLNPVDDSFFSYTLSTARPDNYSRLTPPGSVAAVASGFNVNLSWSFSQDDFDGYEILRAGDDWNFQVVGTTDTVTNAFVDVNALVKTGEYHYVVRKFRNEGEVFASTSLIAPVDSLLIAIVDVEGGKVSINQSALADNGPLANIKNLDDPVRLATRKALAVPHHLYVSDEDDRRIELSPTLTIDEWTTDDYITFVTPVNVSYTNQYVVYVNGQESPVIAQLQKTTGTLTFEQPIYDPSSDPSPPTVSVIFPDVPEVDGILPASRAQGISAVQIERGQIEMDRLPDINHQGRIGERLVPASLTPATEDGYEFALPNANVVGTATVFYGVIEKSDDPSNFLAATSSGVLLSDKAGTEWNAIFTPEAPVTRVLATSSGVYLAVTPRIVYQSTPQLTSWVAIDGLIGVKTVRDVVEDDLGNIYASTNQGVFKYTPGQFTKSAWTQTAPFDFGGTDAYALLFDGGGMLFVSTDNGLYESTDQGDSWMQSIEFMEMAPVWSFAKHGTTTFMVSKDRLWRRAFMDPAFVEVSVFSETFARRVVLSSGRIFVTTNNGVLANDPRADINNATIIKMLPAFQALQRNGKMPAPTSLDAIGGNLYIGTEQYLFGASPTGKLRPLAEYPQATVPTISVNGFERQLGVYFAANGASVFFDQRRPQSDEVAVINNYSSFVAEFGGWADANYRAVVNVHINDNRYESSAVVPDYAAIGNMPLPTFDPRTANMPAAIAAMGNLVPYLNGFVSRSLQQTQFNLPLVITPEAMSQLFSYVEALRASLYPELQTKLIVPAIPETFTRVFPLEDVSDSLRVTVQANVVDGTFTITPQIDKYDAISIDILSVPITSQGKNDHWQVEDAIEKVNSGLPTRLARVQQSNVLKLGIYNERLYPGEQETLSTPFQANYSTPCGGTDWYDRLNSTVDFNVEFDSTGDGLDLPRATAAIAVAGGAWVGGVGGIVSVSPTTGEVVKVPFPTMNPLSVLDLYDDGTTVYVLTTEGLFRGVGGVLTKDVDLPLPNNVNSLLYVRGGYIASTPDGVFIRRTYDLNWNKVLDIQDARITPSGQFVAAFGKDPSKTTDTLTFTSANGTDWSNRARLEGLDVVAAARIASTIYYATPTGLYRHDLAVLNDGEPVITLVDLLGDREASAALSFNDVSADTTRVVAAVEDGTYWTSTGTADFASADSGLGVLHKSQLIGGLIWLFGRGLVKVEGFAQTIRLSTGELLL
jgi:hypothetical protein